MILKDISLCYYQLCILGSCAISLNIAVKHKTAHSYIMLLLLWLLHQLTRLGA